MPRPQPKDFAQHYAGYVALVPRDDILAALNWQTEEILALYRGISEATSLVKHPPYTWSVKQVVGHINDGERVFGYRALCLSRGETAPLPGFDENAYVNAAQFDRYPFRDLVAEFEALRRANVLMLQNLVPEAWGRAGTVWERPLTTNAQAFILAGHAQHHVNILRRRLGQ